ncbi:hypothetical protein R1flu_013459 [Riccia fluitans]|uniref:4-coumarate--CoA ligase n=1 Tax=Riccia fluitans TaxID=41844 RepID=A0ABD1YDD5_9MARC
MDVIETAEGHGFSRKDRIWRSVRIPIQIPEDESVDSVEFFNQRGPDTDAVALVDAISGEEISYKKFRVMFRTVGSGLHSLGLKKGDVILLLSPNSILYPVLIYGCWSIGVIVTTVNPVNTTYEIEKQLKDSGARMIFTVPALYSKVEKLGKPVVMIATAEEEKSLPKSITPFSKLLSADPSNLPKVIRRQSETAALLYSSGTTGMSKGVVLTHRNIIAVILQLLNDAPPEVRERRYMVMLPMYHIYGLAVVTLAQFIRPGTLVILPRFEPELFFRTIEKYRITDLPVVPPIIIMLTKSKEVDRYDLSSLVELTTGAAPCGIELTKELHARLRSVRIRQGFGMTETTGLVGVNECRPDLSHFGSTGTLVSNMEAKIVDISTGKALLPYEQGEIWVRGPNVMKEYLNNVKETASTIDSEGWLHTGDLGYYDKTGQLHVVDRLKELIKFKGFQVAPAELEALLLTHPQISDAAVVPLPDDKAGEVPVAYVVKDPTSNLTEKEVIAFAAEKVSPYKRLHRVTFIAAIPKSPSGKILRRELSLLAKQKAKL